MSGAKAIARNTAVQAGGEMLAKVASLAFYVVMARTLGKVGFGHYMFALSLAVLLTTFAGFGTDNLLTREISRDRDAVHGLFFNAVAIKVAFGVVLSAVAVVIAVAGGYSATVRLTVGLVAVGSVVEMLAKTIGATFLAHDDVRPVALGLLLQRSVTAIVGIAALLAGGGIVIAGAIYLGGAAIALAYVSRALLRHGIRPRRELSLARSRALVMQAAPIGLVVIFNTVVFRIDATMLSLIKGGAAVGLYSAAYRALESTLFLVYAFSSAALPTLSRLRRDTTPPVSTIYETGLKATAAVMVPVGAVFLLFGATILKLLYGADFLAATTALHWLGGAAALYGVSFLSGSLIVGQDRAPILAWVTGCVMVENIVLNLILIPRHSLVGAAASTTITELTAASVLLFFALRLAGPISARRILLGPFAGVLAIGAIAGVLGRSLPALVAALVVYVLVIAAAERLAFPDDFSRAATAVRRRLRPAV